MTRIARQFDALRASGRKALIPYITAGDPQPSVTLPLMHALVAAGADIIELGVPFSDPMADGPVIQQASERALKHHVSLKQVMEMVREFRKTNDRTPVVLMGYLNPIEVMGYARFAKDAAAAGVDGVLTVDMPPEEADDYIAALRAAKLDPIFLLAPTSGEDRLRRVVAAASGFLYYVSLRGVTGAAHLDVNEVSDRVQAIRAKTKLPVGVGFGISDAASAARVAMVADAVVVGSAVVRRVAELAGEPERIPGVVSDFVKSLRVAMDNTVSAKAGTAGG
jgi:tryptophan synthase alpha chain